MAGRGRGNGRGRPSNEILGKRTFEDTSFPYSAGQKNQEKMDTLIKEKHACTNFKKRDWVDKKASQTHHMQGRKKWTKNLK